MRHLWSLLAGVLAAPLAWAFLATGQHRSERTVAGWDDTGLFDTAELIGPAAFLAAAGVVLGLLGTLRWSPLGPLVAGLLLVTPTVLLFINPFETLDALAFDAARADGEPVRVLSQDLQPWLPVANGTLLVLGALLLMAVLSGQRWRRWPTAAAPAVTAGPEAQAGPPAPGGEPRPGPMSDEEILAAAAAMEEDAAPGRPAAEPRRPAEPGAAPGPEPGAEAGPEAPSEPTAPAEPETPPEPGPEPEPEPEPGPEPAPGTERTDRPGPGTGGPGR
jgi:hypothetical protein